MPMEDMLQCLVSKEMRILELASGVQGYLRLSLSSLDTEISLRKQASEGLLSPSSSPAELSYLFFTIFM